MQTAKPRIGSLEVPQRTSPVTPRTRASKSGDNGSHSANSATSARTSTERSPKVIVGRSPRSPVTEKKHPTRSELESQIIRLQQELKKSREQLISSETCKKQMQQEAEEAKKQIQDMSAKLDNSHLQLIEFSTAEEARLQELHKISQDRDCAWQSELEAIQKQHSIDSAALVSAMNEIQRLKQQLEMVLKSEAAYLKQFEATHSELHTLQRDMAETLSSVEKLRDQLKNSKKTEAEAHALVDETRGQLEKAKATIETLRCQGLRHESISSKAAELEESRAKIETPEKVVKGNLNLSTLVEEVHCCNKGDCLESEVEELRSALEEIEIKYQSDQIKSTLQIQSAYELMEQVKSDYGLKESELQLASNNAKEELSELKAKLTEKEEGYQRIADCKELNAGNGVVVQRTQLLAELESKLLKSTNDITELKSNLMDKQTVLQNFLEENEMLKSEISKKEAENRKSYEATIVELELARAAEQDAFIRLGCVTEESDKNSRRAARLAEQLDAAQAVNSETETELKRLRIQCDQWRKAAEAAASILSSGTNGRQIERTGSLDTDYGSIAGKLMSSPFLDELEEESPKKNTNVLRKIGGLWRKSPK